MYKRILMAMAMLFVTAQVFAAGAIALNKHTLRYGYSYNYATQHQADDRALRECGYGCVILLRFHGCAALAFGAHRRAYGAGRAPTRHRARHIALSYCHRYGGRHCRVHAAVCNRGHY